MTSDYTELPGFGGVFLEESYVLDVVATPGSLRIELDVVLEPSHPNYIPPAEDERFCFRRARLLFEGVRGLRWEGQGAPSARDASGEVDLGHIDSCRLVDSTFELEGDWGQLEVVADAVRLVLLASTVVLT